MSYTSEAALLERFDSQGRQLAFQAHTAEELLLWRTQLRARLRALIGLDEATTCPLDAEHGPVEQCAGFTRQRVTIAVEPGLRMPLFALVPAGLPPGERRPVVLAPHGHGGGGKDSVAGLRDHPAIAHSIAQYHYDYGVQLAQAGFVVLCPDARGFGERRERPMQGDDDNSVLSSSCRVLNNMALPLGRTVTGMWVWDLMRLADYAATRDDCDATRLGGAGLSGGGLQVLWLAALDDRVRCAVVSGYFYGYKDALLRLSENCSCNYVPGLWQAADMGDIAALIAPRPLLIESGSRDPLNGVRGLANVREQLDITRAAYTVLGAKELLAHSVFDGNHRWDGAEAAPWLWRHLGLAEG
jgi:dienelactone hydrolase